MKLGENSKTNKSKSNFWNTLSQISDKEKRQEIEDLGYDPSKQHDVGKERISD